jgi:hypothetical protein
MVGGALVIGGLVSCSDAETPQEPTATQGTAFTTATPGPATTPTPTARGSLVFPAFTPATPTPTRVPDPITPDATLVPTPTSDGFGLSPASRSLELTPTYESVGIILQLAAGSSVADPLAAVAWRLVGEGTWSPGHPLVYDGRDALTQRITTINSNPYRDQFRGSLVGLAAGTDYEVRVNAEGRTYYNHVSTWPETDTITDVGTRGRELFVGGQSGRDSGDGSREAPWSTIQRAADVARAGDTVTVAPGTYAESVTITRSGSPLQYVTFRSSDPREARLVLPDGAGQSDDQQIGFLVDAGYVRIIGFAIEGMNSGIMISGSSHDVIVENNHVSDFWADGDVEGCFGSGGDAGACTRDGYGIRIGGRSDDVGLRAPGSGDAPVRSITVQDNEIEATRRQNDDHGTLTITQGGQGNNVIRRNVMRFAYRGDGLEGENCISHVEGSSIDESVNDTDVNDNRCVGATDDAFEFNSANLNLRVWGNVAFASNAAISVAANGVGPSYFFRNLFYAPTASWTACAGITTGASSTGYAFFYHNTMHYPERCDVPVGEGAISHGVQGLGVTNRGETRYATNQVYRNNLFAVAGRLFELSADGQGQTLTFDADYNTYFDYDDGVWGKRGASWGSFDEYQAHSLTNDQHSSNAEPLWRDAMNADLAGRDYRLVAGSAGVDAGTEIPGFNDTSSRWPGQDSAPDAGAFEYHR